MYCIINTWVLLHLISSCICIYVVCTMYIGLCWLTKRLLKQHRRCQNVEWSVKRDWLSNDLSVGNLPHHVAQVDIDGLVTDVGKVSSLGQALWSRVQCVVDHQRQVSDHVTRRVEFVPTRWTSFEIKETHPASLHHLHYRNHCQHHAGLWSRHHRPPSQ